MKECIKDTIIDELGDRILVLEQTIPHLATREQFAELISEFRTIKWIVGGGFILQIMFKWLGF